MPALPIVQLTLYITYCLTMSFRLNIFYHELSPKVFVFIFIKQKNPIIVECVNPREKGSTAASTLEFQSIDSLKH